jgi:YozE SAM-like fold
MRPFTFFQWIKQQQARQDDLGALARVIVKDKIFPKRAKRLYMFLLRYDDNPSMRKRTKKAHAQYRSEMRARAAAWQLKQQQQQAEQTTGAADAC